MNIEWKFSGYKEPFNFKASTMGFDLFIDTYSINTKEPYSSLTVRSGPISSIRDVDGLYCTLFLNPLAGRFKCSYVLSHCSTEEYRFYFSSKDIKYLPDKEKQIIKDILDSAKDLCSTTDFYNLVDMYCKLNILNRAKKRFENAQRTLISSQKTIVTMSRDTEELRQLLPAKYKD